MIVWICTDMEGLAGIDKWEQCYDEDDNSHNYLYGREQLTLDVNAAVAGCFDAGADEVRVIDGHGRNRFKGFVKELLDPRTVQVGFSAYNPLRMEKLDQTVNAVAMIGQHAMAGTYNAFIDHTQIPKQICRYMINGEEHGEMEQFALYAGCLGIPLVYVSGDEALCSEASRLFPHALSTPTKRGTSWSTCELYDPVEVRKNIRKDISCALQNINPEDAWNLQGPVDVSVEWAYSGMADQFACFPGVSRPHSRVTSWKISQGIDIYNWPNPDWTPMQE